MDKASNMFGTGSKGWDLLALISNIGIPGGYMATRYAIQYAFHCALALRINTLYNTLRHTIHYTRLYKYISKGA